MQQTLEIKTANAIKAYNAANAEGKGLLERLLGKENLNMKITERVKDFNDILSIAGKTMADMVRPGDTEDESAYRMVKLIAEVYNEGEILDPMNTKQDKYYPWHKIDPSSGFGLSFHGCAIVSWYSFSVVGVRLCFKNADLATDAGKKFIEIYAKLKIS